MRKVSVIVYDDLNNAVGEIIISRNGDKWRLWDGEKSEDYSDKKVAVGFFDRAVYEVIKRLRASDD